MSTKENQNPSTPPPDEDWSKEIEVAEGIRNRALENYKQITIDTWNIQHSVIRNYLWLSLTFLAAYFTFFWKIYEQKSLIDDYCPLIILALAIASAFTALIIGIRSMTGANSNHPSDNYVEAFKYLTSEGYYQGNHYAHLEKEISTIKQAIEQEEIHSHHRGIAMRRMNQLLIFSACFGVLSALLYFVSTTF